MKEATSCGGVIIYRGKILLLYKNYRNKYEGWVLPKGTVEEGETYEDTAIREIKEESGAQVNIRQYIGDTTYTFSVGKEDVNKMVHWYLCEAQSYFCKPQKEEFFEDAGFYKYHEAIHLMKFSNERHIVEKAYEAFVEMRRKGDW